MAWTTPKTWASGYVVLAADLNTHLRDNLNVTAPAVLTTAGDILYASGANTPARLAMATKGHVMVGGGSGVPGMLAVGTNDHVLTADSTAATGVKWAAGAAGKSSGFIMVLSGTI